MLSALQSNHTLRKRLLDGGNAEEQVADFEDVFFHAGFDTIDQFLEARFGTEHIRKIGREALVGTLSHKEDIHRLFTHEDHWYRELMLYLYRNRDHGAISSQSFSFVSFNYDRSLRHYLHKSLSSRNDALKRPLESDFLTNKNFLHVHGHIGFLPWQKIPTDRDYAARRYGDVMSHEDIVTTARSVLLPHEDFSTPSEIRANINGADNIVFLGFGFHAQNLPRVHFDEILTSKARIYATAHKLDPVGCPISQSAESNACS